jgi:hypothetical protein
MAGRPSWTRDADALLARISATVRVIGVCTPENLDAELAALREAFSAGRPRRPRFRYRAAHGDPTSTLAAAAAAWRPHGDLGAVYADRAEELLLEAALCREVDRPGFGTLAARRYPASGPHYEAADALARSWLARAGDPRARTIVSDDDQDPRSLINRLRAEIGARRLAVRVRVVPRLSSLAATGPGIVYVAAGTPMHERDVERTVHHEIVGHVLPRLRAARCSLGIFAFGTAGGTDDQEGRALWLEQGAGYLDDERCAELARRHLAGRCVREGRDFVETVQALQAKATPLTDALRIAARSHRGGGLARELVYLPTMLRVQAAFDRAPELERVLEAGQISIAAAPTLKEWVVSASA